MGKMIFAPKIHPAH
jgi:ubiquinol-cytochrome c reductase cytochrome c1 subunit